MKEDGRWSDSGNTAAVKVDIAIAQAMEMEEYEEERLHSEQVQDGEDSKKQCKQHEEGGPQGPPIGRDQQVPTSQQAATEEAQVWKDFTYKKEKAIRLQKEVLQEVPRRPRCRVRWDADGPMGSSLCSHSIVIDWLTNSQTCVSGW